MPWVDILWSEKSIEHLAEHGVSVRDAHAVLENPSSVGVSRSSGRPIAFGLTADGRRIAVVFERIDRITVRPITAFEV